MRKILLANQIARVFTFDLFDLLILIPGVHCYIVLLIWVTWIVDIGHILIQIKKSQIWENIKQVDFIKF